MLVDFYCLTDNHKRFPSISVGTIEPASTAKIQCTFENAFYAHTCVCMYRYIHMCGYVYNLMMYYIPYRPIIAPMLTANRENSYYANFWCGINEDVSSLLIVRETTQHCAPNLIPYSHESNIPES